jgi:hypothetical protein
MIFLKRSSAAGLLRRFVDKHVHLIFPDLLGREALAHRPAQGEEREIAFGHGTTVREQLWVIQPVVQIQRIERGGIGTRLMLVLHRFSFELP